MSAIAAPLKGVRAVILDADGVITDSARLHAAAWKSVFDAFLLRHPPHDPAQQRPFDTAIDYPQFVDGRSRPDAAACFLASRGLRPDPEQVHAVATAKDSLYAERLRCGGVSACPGSVALLRTLLCSGVLLAAVSASRYARDLLVRSGVLSLFDAVVDGPEAARLGLPGKPAPDLFLEAARRLRHDPRHTAVIDDALAGVEAAGRGGFAPVIGVDRTENGRHAPDLLRHGADLVVHDLGELVVEGPTA
ncbi:HAD family hydrolase [Actinomycetota bacterium Odt1-20B]